MYARETKEGLENNAFTLIYPFMSLIGGTIGIIVAKHWGGLKSYLGRSISFFSFSEIVFFGGVT